MNKKNIGLLVIAFLLFPISLLAQQEEKAKEWEKHRIKFTPTRLINAYYPGLELGYEYCYGNFSSQLSAAYLFVITSLGNYYSCKGYHFKFEEKYFTKIQPSRRVKFYVSTEICYNYVEQNRDALFLPVEYQHSKYWHERYEYAYTRNYNLQKKAIVTNLRFGVQIKVKRLLIDPSGGIGIGFQNVVYYDNLHPDDILIRPNRTFNFIRPIMDKEGNHTLLNFTMSIRVGYMF